MTLRSEATDRVVELERFGNGLDVRLHAALPGFHARHQSSVQWWFFVMGNRAEKGRQEDAEWLREITAKARLQCFAAEFKIRRGTHGGVSGKRPNRRSGIARMKAYGIEMPI